MAGRGLLSRIGTRGAYSRADSDIDSIIEHLRALLNARRGHSPAVSHFGLPDFTDLAYGFPSSIQALQRAIRDSILEFEPRLKNVNVRHIPDEEALVLRFEITARLVHEDRALKLQTRVVAGGKFDVG
jgi:type VI secretion system protein